MNTKTFIAAVALALGSASSFADSFTWHALQIDETPSTLTREQVRAELDRANAAGEVMGFGYSYRATVPTARAKGSPSLTRAQVKAELAAAQKNGELPLGGFGARSLRDIYPDRYPAVPPTNIAHSGAAVNAN